MTMPDQPDIAPCPRCGRPSPEFHSDLSSMWRAFCPLWDRGCGFDPGAFHSQAAAVDCWNRIARAIPVERVREVLGQAADGSSLAAWKACSHAIAHRLGITLEAPDEQ